MTKDIPTPTTSVLKILDAQEADRDLTQALNACRSLSFELSALSLSPKGLLPAIEILAAEYERRFGVKISLLLSDQAIRFRPEIEILLYQSTRELLLSALKHANSFEVEVSIFADEHSIKIAVRDWGVGFGLMRLNTQSKSQRAMGLVRMRQAIESVGGALLVLNCRDGGACFTIVLPTTP